jgi:defect in organelle trafficking protein DotD
MSHTEKTRFILIVTVVATSLAGCATVPQLGTGPGDDAQAAVDRQILAAAEKIQRAQAALYQAGALDSAVPLVAAEIKDDERRVSLTWKGDAAELAQQLARDRGWSFVTTGVRLPLPVNLTVTDEPFRSVLQLLRAQMGYRAAITLQADRLMLEYNRPQP